MTDELYVYYDVECKGVNGWYIHPLANSLPPHRLKAAIAFKDKARSSNMKARVVEVTVQRKVVSK
jgi:hypothetical protein